MSVNFSVGKEPYSILIERIKKPGSKTIVMEKAYRWMQDDPEFSNIIANTQNGMFKASAKFEYPNEVVLEEVFLTPRMGEKTSGQVNYEIIVTVTDTGYCIEFTHFTHVSSFNDKEFSFGLIPKYPESFYNQCKENPEWCKLVWMDITKTARLKTRMKLIKASW